MILKPVMALVLSAVLLAACAPYRIPHKQVVFDVAQSLVTTERATEQPGVDWPVRMTLTRERYRIEFEMPIESTAQLSFRVHSSEGAPMVADGAHVHAAHPATVDSTGAQLFYFDVKAADGAPLEFIVRNADGAELGRERLTWRTRNHGTHFGIEWI
jgi:hypothetical protein